MFTNIFESKIRKIKSQIDRSIDGQVDRQVDRYIHKYLDKQVDRLDKIEWEKQQQLQSISQLVPVVAVSKRYLVSIITRIYVFKPCAKKEKFLI